MPQSFFSLPAHRCLPKTIAAGLLTVISLSLTGCLTDITIETAEYQRKSQSVSRTLEGVNREHQMIVLETADASGSKGLVPKLKTLLAEVEGDLARKKSELEVARQSIEKDEAYIRKHLSSAGKP